MDEFKCHITPTLICFQHIAARPEVKIEYLDLADDECCIEQYLLKHFVNYAAWMHIVKM